ncbi:MAG TPA: tetraacyldisaccharide 4'-kinase [Candidatus Binataceae bacterium]|nr:tetraacyldisaccharide 4'-kinase [Candidatus Binataceae bacterium]
MTAADVACRRPILDRLWEHGPFARSFGLITYPLSAGYAGIVAARSAWWRRMARRASLPVVSVGNLTVGGNGKTPFALFLAARLRDRAIRVAIVSRGYGGSFSGRAGLVSDGRRILMTAREAGDEAVMLAKLFDGPIAVARRRIHAIEMLAERDLADAVVLDDAFQHLRLARELDLVLIKEPRAFGNGRLLPAGPMRERASALRRADAIVLVRSPGSATDTIDPQVSDLARGKLLLRAILRPSGLIRSDSGGWSVSPLALEGRRIAAVSGIADADGFHSMLRALGADLVRSLDYSDHHVYSPGDWRNILEAARGLEMLVTTEKDLVKLESFATGEFPLYALRVAITMEQHDETLLLTKALDCLGRRGRPRTETSTTGKGGNTPWL